MTLTCLKHVQPLIIMMTAENEEEWSKQSIPNATVNFDIVHVFCDFVHSFYFLLDCAIVNACILFSSVHPDESMTMLNFRQKLFRGLVLNYTSRRRRFSLAGSAFVCRRNTHSAVGPKKADVPDDICLLSVGVHMPQAMSCYRRCRVFSSRTNNKRSKIQCSMCDVVMCVAPCFAIFHK